MKDKMRKIWENRRDFNFCHVPTYFCGNYSGFMDYKVREHIIDKHYSFDLKKEVIENFLKNKHILIAYEHTNYEFGIEYLNEFYIFLNFNGELFEHSFIETETKEISGSFYPHKTTIEKIYYNLTFDPNPMSNPIEDEDLPHIQKFFHNYCLHESRTPKYFGER